MHEQSIAPKTYMILARRSNTDTTFCELTGVKNSLRHWVNWPMLTKTMQSYLVYKFDPDTAMYELKFDGQSAVDLFDENMSTSDEKKIFDVIIETLV